VAHGLDVLLSQLNIVHSGEIQTGTKSVIAIATGKVSECVQ